VSLTLNNVGSGQYYLWVSYTDSGIADVAVTLASKTTVMLTVNFRAPTSLKPKTYTDSAKFQLCQDSKCAEPIAGAATSISISYTITSWPANAAPTLTFPQIPLSIQALAIDPFYPASVSENFSMANFVVAPYLTATTTNSGIRGVSPIANSTTQGTLSASAQPGDQMGAGTYTGTILVTACLDATCVNPVPGSPFSIDVTYTVGNAITVGGSNGYTLQGIPVPAMGMVWDPLNKLIWLVLQPDGTGHSHVVSVDPSTTTISSPVELDGAGNGAIAISDDSQFLYVAVENGEVGEIQRLSLPSLASNLIFAVGQPLGNGAAAIQVAPATPHTIAVALSKYSSPITFGYETGVAVFDDNVMRTMVATATPANPPASATGTVVDYLQWGPTAATLYGSGFSGATASIYTMSVDANGIETATNEGNFSGGMMHPAQGLLYLDGGTIFNPTTNTANNKFTATPNLYGLLPDAAASRLFVSSSSQLEGTVVLQSYDLQSLTPISQLMFPSIVSQQGQWLLWGQNGIAILTSQYNGPFLFLVSGSFVSP
jgi:hypothetical protein